MRPLHRNFRSSKQRHDPSPSPQSGSEEYPLPPALHGGLSILDDPG